MWYKAAWDLFCTKKGIMEQLNKYNGDTCFIFIESSFFIESSGWKLTTQVEIYLVFWRDKSYNKGQNMWGLFQHSLSKVHWNFHTEKEKLVQCNLFQLKHDENGANIMKEVTHIETGTV